MSEENVEVVRQGYEAFNDAWSRGEIALLKQWLQEYTAPNFEFVPSEAFVGLSDRSPGYEGFIRIMESFWNRFEAPHAEVDELLDVGDSVLARVIYRGKGAASGAAVNMTLFQLWTVRDGKLVRGQDFTSRSEALEAAGLSE